MKEGKFEELLNRELDGDTTARETARLQEHLSKHSHARAYREDLANLASTFERVRVAEPPPGLREAILQAVRGDRAWTMARPASTPATQKNGWRAIWGTLRRRLSVRSPYAFAGGLAVGVLLFAAFTASFSSRFRVDGSIAPGALVPRDELAVYAPLERQPIRLDGVRGEIATKIYGDRLLVELQLDSIVPVDVVVTPGSGRVIPVAFRQLDPTRGRVELTEMRVSITHEGTNEYYVVVRRVDVGSSRLHVRAQAGDETSEITLKTR